MKKRVVVALGHRALGTTLPEQKEAVKKTAKVIADMVAAGYLLLVTSLSPWMVVLVVKYHGFQ